MTPKKIRSLHRWPAGLSSVQPPVPRPPRSLAASGRRPGVTAVTPRRTRSYATGLCGLTALTPAQTYLDDDADAKPCRCTGRLTSLSGTPNAFRAGKLDKHFFATGRRKRCTGLDSCNKGLPRTGCAGRRRNGCGDAVRPLRRQAIIIASRIGGSVQSEDRQVSYCKSLLLYPRIYTGAL